MDEARRPEKGQVNVRAVWIISRWTACVDDVTVTTPDHHQITSDSGSCSIISVIVRVVLNDVFWGVNPLD